MEVDCASRLRNKNESHSFFSVLVLKSAKSYLILVMVEYVAKEAEHQPPLIHPRNNARDSGINSRFQSTIVEDQSTIYMLRLLGDLIFDKHQLVRGSGCVRADIVIHNNDLSLREVRLDLKPRIFWAGKDTSADDWMIERCPGGHESLLCLFLATHQKQPTSRIAKRNNVRTTFDILSSHFDDAFQHTAHVAVLRSLAFRFDWSGTVLDVGCGTGMFGGTLSSYHDGYSIYGTDLSQPMVEAPLIKAHYEAPIAVGPMEELLMGPDMADHLVCFSVLQYVDAVTFKAVLSQMFLKARQSVTFDVPDVTVDYISRLSVTGSFSKPANHLLSLQKFGTPHGWKLVMDRYTLSYTEPNFSLDIYSRYLRFEKATQLFP